MHIFLTRKDCSNFRWKPGLQSTLNKPKRRFQVEQHLQHHEQEIATQSNITNITFAVSSITPTFMECIYELKHKQNDMSINVSNK